jgi:hypothetical protein
MYVGMYLTLAAPSLYTINPLVILAAIFVIAVHHGIVRVKAITGGRYSAERV